MKLIMKTVYLLVGILFVTTTNAQIMCSLGNAPAQQYNPTYDQKPSPRASSELKTIYRALCPSGCGNYVLASNPTAPNALATTIGPGASKIAFNSNFMNQVAQVYGGGATFGILAHEFGHHIDFHTTPPWMNNSWSRELKADAWAGCALARVGQSTNQIESSLQAIAAYPSPTHPGWQQRHHAVRTGFINCGGVWKNQFNIGFNQVPQNPPVFSCQTNFGRCQLPQALPAGSRCSCSVLDPFGRITRQDPGIAR